MAELIPPECLAVATILQEAATEPYEGKLAVACVIRERTRLKFQSNGTVAGTVLEPYAFSGWNSKGSQRIPTATLEDSHPTVVEARKAWLEAEHSPNLPPGTVLYYNPKAMVPVNSTPSWEPESVFVKKVGHHLFFRPKG